MPFGLTNAPATFQRCMNQLFKEDLGKIVQPYLDDIIVFSKSYEEHKVHLEQVLKRIRESGLKLNPKKCKFFKSELEILGLKVRKNMISPTDDRIQNIKAFPEPKTIREVRSFLGFASYCRNFIKDLAHMAQPLTEILKDNPPEKRNIALTDNQRKAFETIKQKLDRSCSLAIPDYSKPFILTTDASNFAVGAVLAQKDTTNKEIPICFFSKKLSASKCNYSTTHREFLAVVEAIHFFKPYLMHRKFLLRTDHQALTALKHTRNQNSLLLRWSLFLADFTFDIEYIKGEVNPADALSRVATAEEVQKTCKKYIIEPENDLREDIIRNYHLTLGHEPQET